MRYISSLNYNMTNNPLPQNFSFLKQEGNLQTTLALMNQAFPF